jgi:hypothetical protein
MMLYYLLLGIRGVLNDLDNLRGICDMMNHLDMLVGIDILGKVLLGIGECVRGIWGMMMLEVDLPFHRGVQLGV